MAFYNPAVDNGPGSIVPVPVSSSYCVPSGTQLTVASKATLTKGDQYTIHDSQGQLMFDVKAGGKHGWLRKQRILCDPSGKTLAFMKQKTLTLHDRWDVYGDEEASDSSFLFTMRTTGLSILTAPSFGIFLVNNQSKSPDFDIVGKGVFKVKFTILNRSSPIAEAKQKGNEYSVTVNPGVDLAFISSVIVIIDQVLKSEKEAADAVGEIVGA